MRCRAEARSSTGHAIVLRTFVPETTTPVAGRSIPDEQYAPRGDQSGARVRGMDDRLTDLEIKVAYQDKTIADLEALVRGFGVRLDQMTRELEQLKNGIRSPEVPLGPQSDKPPHY